MDYRDNRQRWAESHQVVHFYAGQWCTFTPALTTEVLGTEEYLAALADFSGQWIDRVLDRRPPKMIILESHYDREVLHHELSGYLGNVG